MRVVLAIRFSIAIVGAACLASVATHAANTLVPPGVARYTPTGFPDRIVATPSADLRTGFAVSWRTDANVDKPLLQISIAKDSPDLAEGARSVRAATRELRTENGVARHHRAHVDGLAPDTLYAYRVQGKDTWSEWFHLRTAASDPKPFSFLYFGDAQNSVKSLYSRVVREAWRREPQAALMLHAGDLINGRDERDDDEWGEWFDAGAFLHATSLVVPAAGNHEYDAEGEGAAERHTLKSSWSSTFTLPSNGVESLRDSTYTFDYQGARFVVLDSMSALNNGSATAQGKWLAAQLSDNPNRWTVAMFHHPMFSASRGRDNPPLREHWLPVLRAHGVDLVLQGHDHVYGRGRNANTGARASMGEAGPVFVVSVAGPKQYRVSDTARRAMTRSGENTQLFQIVRVEPDRLRYESRTATGVLYDVFELRRDAQGRKRLVESDESNEHPVAPRICPHEKSPSGRADRCWGGDEW